MKPSGHFHTIIIGGGPAGLFAAAHLTREKVLLIEKNKVPGRKLMISGNGQCNFTHSGKIDDFNRHYGSNYSFLSHALNGYTNKNVIDFFEDRGIKLFIDKNGKVFPHSLKAADILDALLTEIKKRNVELSYGKAVVKVQKVKKKFIVSMDCHTYTCNHLLIATGGLSYPSTGSDGDGFKFARVLGHTITATQPALCPVIPNAYPFSSLSGISLRAAKIFLFRRGTLIQEHRGDVGFTHTGLSGPGIIDFSRYIIPGDVLKVNLAGTSPEKLETHFLQQSQAGNTTLLSFLRHQSMVRNLGLALLKLNQLSPEKPLAEVSRMQRKKLINDCCAYPFEVQKLAGYKKAMATAGGVALNEIHPSTMESRITRHLYFAGEVMDVDGDTGGYNIQAAFSTGWLAAQSINISPDE
ncbi:MAG TPA: NAD(P)/FAD-dependent oxidoreductase [Bacteroidales bacterium]|jgi:predicted Rossmann fold flavoprotein|nr:NAD(P)/FAD-dependent oxidoreductase [Lentimicrobiaceae bacterium]HAH59975.1 NAD(P)/FAD-dependent oxidoreductase [Bacteroidales bacterium]